MAGTDTAVFDDVLKVVYGPGIAELIPTKHPALDMFAEGDSSAWGGKYVEYPVNVARSEGAGYASEGGLLPSAGREKYADMRIGCRFQYGRITVTAQVLKQSQGNKNAFAAAMEREMAGVIKTMAADRGRAIMHDGREILALVNGNATSATQTVDSPGGVAGSVNGSRFIRPGMIVGCINPATQDVRASTVATIQSVTANGNQVVLDASKTWVDNDYIVRFTTTTATSVTDTSYGKGIMGLLGLIDDGTYVATLHNINRTTYPMFASKVITSVGPLSADVFQRGIDVAEEVGDGDVSDFIMHHSVRRAYLALMDADRRYSGGDLNKPDAGTAAARKGGRVTFGGIPITEEKYSPYGIVFGVDKSGFKRWSLVNGEWADEDGAVLCRVGTGSSAADQFEAFYRIWDNFSNDYPNRSFRLDGVTATVVVVQVP